ncbi:MAG TPA: adenylate/guanylate cyclase domain-containing protein [Candidatus Rifleibacterium sp.]|nr:adenylate/guanylate cyclase domain-containing protein [Candidatus Rifleibacterium sp.]HPT47154.1 adenylate/guanylate cyclase domain-containing protein [Candidatus Rifleibacterium sp.]
MKKAIVSILVTLIVFFPPLSIYFATKEANQLQINQQQGILNERAAADLLQLRGTSDDANYLIRSHTAISKILRHEEYRLLQKPHSDEFKQFLAGKINGIIAKAGFPCEFEFLIRDAAGQVVESLHFGKDLGLQAITAELKSPATPKSLEPWQKYYRNALPHFIDNNITKIVIRQPGTSMTISGENINRDLLVFALGDHSGQSPLQNLKITISRFPARTYGLGAYSFAQPSATFSDYFSGRTQLKKMVVESCKNASERGISLKTADHLLLVSEFDYLKKCRYFAAVPLKTGDKPFTDIQMLMQIIIWLISCSVFKVLIEKIVLSRGPDISFMSMIPAVFIFLIIQPGFASAYLTGEFFRLSFAGEKDRVTDKLINDLQNIDRKTLDAGFRTLNIARGLNSIERIASYSQKPYTGNDTELAIALLNELQIRNKWNLYESLWICQDARNIIGVNLQPQNMFGAEDVDNLVGEIFKARLSEMLSLRKPEGADLATEQAGDKQLQKELKKEISRDFFLKIFGADAFYRFRQSSGFRIDIVVNYRREQVMSVPIDYRGRPHAFAAWYIERDNASLLLDPENFYLGSLSPRIAIYGDEHAYSGVFFTAKEIAGRHPELARVAEATHLTANRNISINETPTHLSIYMGLPAMYSNFTIAGSEMMQSFTAFRDQMKKHVIFLVATVLLIGSLLAFAGALYFVWPLRELTTATRQISEGNFKVRIHEDHPDEFAALGRSFNNMANSLEEGSLLKNFVTDSVRKEVAGGSGTDLSDKAELTNASIVFAALCGFAELQKTHTAQQVFDLLQMLLRAADQATVQFGGEIDKMIEDKVMIVFEHRGPDAAACPGNAIRTAAAIVESVEAATGIRVAIGVNTGVTVSGIMGAEMVRLSKTVVGDPVNLSARLAYEALKMRGGIIISGHLLKDVPDGFFAEKLPISSVKGKTQTIEAYLVSRQEKIR